VTVSISGGQVELSGDANIWAKSFEHKVNCPRCREYVSGGGGGGGGGGIRNQDPSTGGGSGGGSWSGSHGGGCSWNCVITSSGDTYSENCTLVC
jgi:hypothetical protein